MIGETWAKHKVIRMKYMKRAAQLTYTFALFRWWTEVVRFAIIL